MNVNTLPWITTLQKSILNNNNNVGITTNNIFKYMLNNFIIILMSTEQGVSMVIQDNVFGHHYPFYICEICTDNKLVLKHLLFNKFVEFHIINLLSDDTDVEFTETRSALTFVRKYFEQDDYVIDIKIVSASENELDLLFINPTGLDPKLYVQRNKEDRVPISLL